MSDPKKIKVAIVHDWLVGGGAERVVLELHKIFPDAPIYTSYATAEWRDKLDNKVVTGYLQRWPFSSLRKFIPLLRMWWFSHLDLSNYDLVISSAGNGEAKDVRTKKGTTHICYCNTPVHFYWRHYEQYLRHPGFGIFDPIARLGLKLLVGPLRKRDFKAAQRPDYFIVNSTHIRNDVKKYYGREATVIHPPVEVDRFKDTKTENRNGFVTAGRQVPHKRTDLILQACMNLGLPLKVIGRGPEHDKLVKMAGPNIEILNNVSDSELPKHLAGAEAFIFASFEDFGIAPVEAIAAGTPVIAYHAGGALDYVVEGKTGMFFDEQSVGSLENALKKFNSKKYSPHDIKRQAEEFSNANFRKNISKFVDNVLQ